MSGYAPDPLRRVLYVLEDDDDLSFWSYVAQMFRSKVELINPVAAKAGLLRDFTKANGVTVTRSCLARFTLHTRYFTFSPV